MLGRGLRIVAAGTGLGLVALEEVITTVGSAAVLVGKDGIGPWEEPEMRACLDECVHRKMPVIPCCCRGRRRHSCRSFFVS